MIELPENYVLAEQVERTFTGKVIKDAVANAHPHSFAWYAGDPAEYADKLRGKTIVSANPGTEHACGGNTEIVCDGALLVISTPVKYHAPGAKLPAKHQLLITFGDGSYLSCTVQMWGAMLAYSTGEGGLPEGYGKKKRPDPMTDGFDRTYFDGLWDAVPPTISVKAFLATEQRIPGLGNGVLQDILFNARVHPKRKLQTLDGDDKTRLFNSVKTTMMRMWKEGGRDTEKDLFGEKGGYKTILSANTLKSACPVCGGTIVREAYMGGNIYFCPNCQL